MPEIEVAPEGYIHLTHYDALQTLLSEVTEAHQKAAASIAALEAAIDELCMTAGWARNTLELMADEAWHGDGRDLKRSLVGMFKEFDEALAKHGIPRAAEARAALAAKP
jgi:hypothetical protein